MMSISRISRLAFEVASYEARITYKCSYAVIASSRKIVSTIFRQGVRNQSTLSNSTAQIQTQQKSWKSYVKEWRWKIPFGIGFSFLAVLQWRYFRKRQEDATTKGPIEGLMVECYCSLPLRITSRVWGGFASLQLPVSLRSVVYSCYAKMFKANLDEIDASLIEFPSLSDFFVRPLKADARIIADHTNMVAPSDGKVLHFGPITSCKVEQVKGMTYNLQHFLGEPNRPQIDKEDNIAKKPVCDNYVTSLLKNPENILYQLTIYLAPGDYHRFHSPADWTINLRRHFQGKLLSVNPKIASWLPDLFALNERVVYIGEWAGGFMAYTAVGATNVGSIHVYKDGELVTNKRKWPRGKYTEDARFEGGMRVQKGELFGEFRMGSTIVLIFEAPRDFEFSTEVGQQIKMGQALTNGIVVS